MGLVNLIIKLFSKLILQEVIVNRLGLKLLSVGVRPLLYLKLPFFRDLVLEVIGRNSIIIFKAFSLSQLVLRMFGLAKMLIIFLKHQRMRLLMYLILVTRSVSPKMFTM